jgi:hypothetical protein
VSRFATRDHVTVLSAEKLIREIERRYVKRCSTGDGR